MADIHLQIRWGGAGGRRAVIQTTGGLTKNCFSALRASFWSENKAGAAPRALSLDPPLCGYVTSRSCFEYSVWRQSRSVV